MLSAAVPCVGLPHTHAARESVSVTESEHQVRVRLVGIESSGVRTLLGAMCGTLQPERAGSRTWDDIEILMSADRPGGTSFDDTDMLIVVVSASQGVPAELGQVWAAAADRQVPALIAVTHIDESGTDLEEIAAMCRRVLIDGGEIFVPWLPILDDDERVCGFISLLSEEIVDWSDGGPVIRASEQRHQELIEEARAELCESVMLAVVDDDLFGAYMSGAAIDGEEIENQMHEQIVRGLRHPVIGTGIAPHLLGVGLLLDTVAEIGHQREA